MIYIGHRDSSMLTILKHYIPIAAAFGGMCIGLLTIIADLMGAIGSGKNLIIRYRHSYGCINHLRNFRNFLKRKRHRRIIRSILIRLYL